jgi:hypothetical protein
MKSTLPTGQVGMTSTSRLGNSQAKGERDTGGHNERRERADRDQGAARPIDISVPRGKPGKN